MSRQTTTLVILAFGVVSLSAVGPAEAHDFVVGPDIGMLASIGDVPWESLDAGDRVFIHWRPNGYKENWVICRRGPSEAPIVISGVPGLSGQLPVIDGRGAMTRTALSYWPESRGVIKIGGVSIPSDTLPAHIAIENLDIRSGRPPYSFTNDSGGAETYANNAAAIYVEKAEQLTIRNCILRDSGNGLFVGAHDGLTQNILIERNWIHGNGIEGSYHQHNTYTAAIGGQAYVLTMAFLIWAPSRRDCFLLMGLMMVTNPCGP